MTKPYIALDMFSGAGGLTEGFIRQGFEFAGHIEMNEDACKTLETRLIYHELMRSGNKKIYGDYYRGIISRDEFIKCAKDCGAGEDLIINEAISDETELEIKKKIKKYLRDNFNGKKTVDVIIGGPPCQAYSMARRGKENKAEKDDPRNFLYEHYISFLKKFKPDFFVFENVPGIRTAKNGTILKDIFNKCDEAGYNIDADTLTASNFGVLQNRKRIIIIGWKKNCKTCFYPKFEEKKPTGHVWNILSNLPKLQADKSNKELRGTDEFQPYPEGVSLKYLKKNKLKGNFGGIRHHEARMHNDRDREIYREAINQWNNGKVRLNYNNLPEKLKTHRFRSGFVDRFKVVDGRGYSHSVIAHIAKDGHYFIHPDIEQARSLTVREVARLQSFPDDYYFEGNRGAKYTQIGNAVPPLMADGIAKEIKKMIDAERERNHPEERTKAEI
ncbi:DNA cytosine methyltransferase [Methanoplanus sp. FWC-SCC4]|uniref:DNA (cytosine-5-)-methyltransferase n=2 Tax=Methanochimaera problematica TaxID=2609417 RepID=A0AA97FEF6_9EURY|nr:DNA cytosine methyltransferase [Methanoplanus sp. FWC-SCC4]